MRCQPGYARRCRQHRRADRAQSRRDRGGRLDRGHGTRGRDAGGRVVLAAVPAGFLEASAGGHTAKALREFIASR